MAHKKTIPFILNPEGDKRARRMCRQFINESRRGPAIPYASASVIVNLCRAQKKRLFTESCGMYLFVYEVSLRDRSYNRLRHRAFHGEAVPGDEKLIAKIPQLFVMNLFIAIYGYL